MFMVYRRGRYSKRGGRRRYGRGGRGVAWYNKKYSAGDMAALALRKVKYIAGLINVEKKKTDIVVGMTPDSTSVEVEYLSDIAQGDTVGARNGNSILVKGLRLSGDMSIHASATNTIVRLMVIRDTQQVADTSVSCVDVLDASVSKYVHAPLNDNTVGS